MLPDDRKASKLVKIAIRDMLIRGPECLVDIDPNNRTGYKLLYDFGNGSMEATGESRVIVIDTTQHPCTVRLMRRSSTNNELYHLAPVMVVNGGIASNLVIKLLKARKESAEIFNKRKQDFDKNFENLMSFGAFRDLKFS